MKKVIIIAAVVVVAAVIVWQLVGRGGPEQSGMYEFVEVERGDIENIISSSGTLSAVGTVEVGTQVSGTIARMHSKQPQEVMGSSIMA